MCLRLWFGRYCAPSSANVLASVVYKVLRTFDGKRVTDEDRRQAVVFLKKEDEKRREAARTVWLLFFGSYDTPIFKPWQHLSNPYFNPYFEPLLTPLFKCPFLTRYSKRYDPITLCLAILTPCPYDPTDPTNNW